MNQTRTKIVKTLVAHHVSRSQDGLCVIACLSGCCHPACDALFPDPYYVFPYACLVLWLGDDHNPSELLSVATHHVLVSPAIDLPADVGDVEVLSVLVLLACYCWLHLAPQRLQELLLSSHTWQRQCYPAVNSAMLSSCHPHFMNPVSGT